MVKQGRVSESRRSPRLLGQVTDAARMEQMMIAPRRYNEGLILRARASLLDPLSSGGGGNCDRWTLSLFWDHTHLFHRLQLVYFFFF